MAAWDQNTMNDAVYDALVAGGITAPIYNKVVPRGEAVTYPVVIYRVWDEPRHEYTLGDGRSSTKLSYRVTVWSKDDGRAAITLAKTVETALTQAALDAAYSGTVLVCRARNIISRVQEYDDTILYHEEGGIYEIEVVAP